MYPDMEAPWQWPARRERRRRLGVGLALGAETKEIVMSAYFGHTVAALALLAGTQAASAQQWVYTPDPVEGRVIATQPLPLTQAQRTIIYRTIIPQDRGRGPIVRERVVTEPVAPAVPVVREGVVTATDLDSYAYDYVPAPRAAEPYVARDAYGAYAYAVGTRVPATAPLAPLPPSVVAQVPEVRSYQYMVVAGRLLLVDPDTGVVVAEVAR
jgi:hypothetical protein